MNGIHASAALQTLIDLMFHDVQRKILLSPDGAATSMRLLKPKKLRRKQFLPEAGDNCGCLASVNTGLLGYDMTDNRSIEHVMQFTLEDF